MIGERVIDSAMQQVSAQSDEISVDAVEIIAPSVTVSGESGDYIAVIAAAYALLETA